MEKHKAAVKELNGVFRPIIIGAVPQLLAMRCSSCATEQLRTNNSRSGLDGAGVEGRLCAQCLLAYSVSTFRLPLSLIFISIVRGIKGSTLPLRSTFTSSTKRDTYMTSSD